MKILAIADEVDSRLYGPVLKQRFASTDLVVSCGDLPIYYLEFVVSVLDVPLLYVRGNHAPEQMSATGEVKTEPEGCTSIDGRVVKVKGLLVGGLEGSMRYSEGPHQYSEREMRLKALRMVPRLLLNKWRYGRYLDILVTHAAPMGIHDGDDLCHLGFSTFIDFMRRFQPRYLIHGHIHVYTPNVVTETRFEDTIVLNAFRYRLVELDAAPAGRA